MITNTALIQLQAASGIVFGSFLSLHLATVLSANYGWKAFDFVQKLTRRYYQYPVVEFVCVFGAASIHITASIIRFFRRRQRILESVAKREGNSPVSKSSLNFEDLHKYSGYFMLASFTGHILGTRIIPSQFNFPVDFQLLGYAFSFPTGVFFFPYSFLFGTSGVYHSLYGSIRAATIFGVKVPENMRSKSFAFKSAVALGTIGMFGALLQIGFFSPRDRFPEIASFGTKVIETYNVFSK